MKKFGVFWFYFLIEYLSFEDGSEQTRIDNIIRLHTAMPTTAGKGSVYHALLTLFLYLPVMTAIFTNKKKIECCSVYILSRTSNKKYIDILLKENLNILLRLIGIKVIAELAICTEEVIIDTSILKTIIEYNLLFALYMAVIIITSELIHVSLNISYKILLAISMAALFLSYFFSGNYFWWDRWLTPISQIDESKTAICIIAKIIFIVINYLIIKSIVIHRKKDAGFI